MNITAKIAIVGALLAAAPAIAAKDVADREPAVKAGHGEWHRGQEYGRHDRRHGAMMHEHGMMGGHGMMRGHGMMGGRGMMTTFDTDGDGRLTQAEIDKFRGDRLAKYDSDGNGRLTLAEYQALWLAAMRERMVDRFQQLDADGDAEVTIEEFKRPFADLVRRMDRNGDGVLTREPGMKHKMKEEREK